MGGAAVNAVLGPKNQNQSAKVEAVLMKLVSIVCPSMGYEEGTGEMVRRQKCQKRMGM